MQNLLAQAIGHDCISMLRNRNGKKSGTWNTRLKSEGKPGLIEGHSRTTKQWSGTQYNSKNEQQAKTQTFDPKSRVAAIRQLHLSLWLLITARNGRGAKTAGLFLFLFAQLPTSLAIVQRIIKNVVVHEHHIVASILLLDKMSIYMCSISIKWKNINIHRTWEQHWIN